MQPNRGDIREELVDRMAAVLGNIDHLKEQRAKIDKQLQEESERLSALRIVYDAEAKRFGEPSGPLFPKRGGPSRFAGMKVGQALKIIRQENPKITKEQAHKLLVKEGFDFGTKRSKSSVHFAWIGLERAKSGQQK